MDILNNVTVTDFIILIALALGLVILILEIVERVARVGGYTRIERISLDAQGRIYGTGLPFVNSGLTHYQEQRERVLADNDPNNDTKYDAVIAALTQIKEEITKMKADNSALAPKPFQDSVDGTDAG